MWEITVSTNSLIFVGILLKNDIKLLNAVGIVLVKKPVIDFHTLLNTFFIPSHKLIQKFLNFSLFFQRIANAPTKPIIAVTIKTIGFTPNATFNNNIASLTLFIDLINCINAILAFPIFLASANIFKPPDTIL